MNTLKLYVGIGGYTLFQNGCSIAECSRTYNDGIERQVSSILERGLNRCFEFGFVPEVIMDNDFFVEGEYSTSGSPNAWTSYIPVDSLILDEVLNEFREIQKGIDIYNSEINPDSNGYFRNYNFRVSIY